MMNNHWATVYADYGCTELTRTTKLVWIGVLTVIDVVYVWVSHIWKMPEKIGHTRLIINGFIGKTIINCYNQLLPINNNDWPAINFWLWTHIPIINLSSWQRREWLEFISRPSISVEGHHRLIISFPIVCDYFQWRKCRFPNVGPRRKCHGFCALKSSEFQLKHALRNFLSMYFH